MYGDHWFGGGFMWIFWLLIVLVILWGIKVTTSGSTSSQQKSALDILKDRYARGEIDEAEFEKKKKNLLKKCSVTT